MSGRALGPVAAAAIAVTAVAGEAAGQEVRRVAFCQQSLSLRRIDDGRWTLARDGSAAVPLGAGAVRTETVPLASGTALVFTLGESDEARVVYALGCSASGITVIADARGQWVGEDIGARTRDAAELRREGGRVSLVVGRHDERARLCGGPLVLLNPQQIEGAEGARRPAELRLEVGGDGAAMRVEREALPVPVLRAPPARWIRRDGAHDGAAVLDGSTLHGAVLSPGLHALTFPLALGPVTLRGLEFRSTRGVPGERLPARWTVLAEPGSQRFTVAIPTDSVELAREHDVAVRLVFPSPIQARCLALIAAVEGAGRGVSEVALMTSLDGDTGAALTALAARADGPEGEEAAGLLASLGRDGVAALATAAPGFSLVGARRAARLLGATQSAVAAGALVRLLARDETTEAAADALRRMGTVALDALAGVVATEHRAARVIATVRAPLPARVRALSSALDAEGRPWVEARAALRGVLPELLRDLDASAGEALIPAGARAGARMLRLLHESLGGSASPLQRAWIARVARTRWAGAEDAAIRYRLAPCLAGDAEGVAILRGVVERDADADLRAEAVRALGAVPEATPALVGALRDATPRVRATAAEALRGRADAVAGLSATLRDDRWPTVRAAAAGSLAGRGDAAAALRDAMNDPSVFAAAAVLRALGATPGEGITARLVAFVDDGRREPGLRREAAEAIGQRCDPSAVPALERLSDSLGDPRLPPWEQEIGHAVVASLARTAPERARAFVQRSGGNAMALAAVERAARNGCPAGR